MNDKPLIEIGTVTGLKVLNKNNDLCKVRIIDQIGSGTNDTIKLLVETYWERNNGNISYMKLFRDKVFVIGNKTFNVVKSSAEKKEDEMFNTVLEYMGEIDKGCDTTFYDGKCIVGCGEYDITKNYDMFKDWKRVISAVYDEENQKRSNYSLYPEWHSFQNFAYWYENNFPKEESEFGSYMLVWDLARRRDIQLSPSTLAFVEVKIMKFPELYKYTLETPTIYSMKVNDSYLRSKGYKDYTVLYYSYISKRIESLGTYRTLEEARKVYLLHLMNKRTKMINYLKASPSKVILEPLIDRFERL